MNAISYIKNVGKSFGYVAVDVVKEMNPAIKSMIETNKDTVESAYEMVKDLKNNKTNTVNKFAQNDYVQLVPQGLHNLLEDLKSGKWYNKDRKEEYENTVMKSMGMDFDFDDIDFDDSFDDINFDNIEMSDTAEIKESMDNVGSKVADAVSTATVRSAEYVANVTQATTRMTMRQNANMFNKVHNGILSLNTSIASITPIIEPLNTHIQNSAVFFTKSTELQEKQVLLLESIAKNTAPIEKKDRNNSSSGDKIDDVLDTEGMLDFSNYFNMVKNNIKNKLSIFTGMGDMFKDSDGNGENIYKQFIASPMEYVINGAIKTLIPKATKDITKSFNDTLSGLAGSLLMKISDTNYTNPVSQFISEVFGVNTSMKKSISTSGYEKGKVDFDGKTRMSIVKVIPTYLSKIYSAVSGKEEDRFDYENGVFVTKEEIERERRYIMDSQVDFNTGYDLLKEFSQNIDKRSDKKELDKSMRKFIESIISSAKWYNPYTDNPTEFGIDEKNAKEINDFLQGILNDKGKSHLLLNMNTNALHSRNNIDKFYRNAESEGDSVLTSIFDRSMDKDNIKKGISLDFNNMRDEYNNNVFFYLQGLYQFTQAIYEGGVGYGGGKRKNSKGPTPLKGFKKPEFENNKEPEYETISKTEYDDIINSIKDKKLVSKIKSEEKDWEYYIQLNRVDQDELISKLIMLRRQQREIDMNGNRSRFDKIMNSEKVPDSLKEFLGKTIKLLDKPTDYFNKLLNNVKVSIVKMIYGDKDKKGLFTNIKENFDKKMENFNKWADEKIFTPLNEKLDNVFKKVDEILNDIKKKVSDKFNKIAEKILGKKNEKGEREDGMFSNIINKTKQNFKSAGNWTKDTFGSVFKRNGKQESNAADGGMVTKTGMIAVSEGELIIPSEYNPFYNKATNKAKQIKDEHDAFRNFYGFYADGGTTGDESIKDKAKNFTKKMGRKARQRAAHKMKNKAKQAAEDAGEAASDKFEEFFGTDEDPTFFRESFNEFKSGFKTFFNKLFGSDEKKETSKINDFINKSMKEIGIADNISGMITGGIIGGGVSLLTGGLVSPLLGAALGSASGLIIKSKTVQEALFGTEDENGNTLKEGLLPKNIAKFIQNKVTGMAKGGAIGAAISMIPGIPGGPVAGMIIGSTISYISQTDKVKEALFGGVDFITGKEGYSKELEARLKKAAPRMAAGAAAGLLVGPFGITGNILVGSAVGFATTSSKFQEALFGKDKDGKGGLVGWIKDKIFKPIADLTKPLVQAIKNTIKSFGKRVSRQLYNMFKESIGIPLAAKFKETFLNPLGNIAKKLLGPLSKMNPLKILTNTGKAIRASQFRKGTASDMSAAERIAYRNKNKMGRDKTSNMDEVLSQMSEEDINDWTSRIQDTESSSKKAYENLRNNFTGMSKQMMTGKDRISAKHTEVVMKMIREQRYDDVDKYLKNNSRNFTEYQINKIKRVINAGKGYNDEYRESVNNANKSQQDLYDEFSKKFGVKINKKNAWRYQDLFKSEIKNRKNIKEDERSNNSPETNAINDSRVEVVTRLDRLVFAVEKIAGIGRSVAEGAKNTAENIADKVVDDVNNFAYGTKAGTAARNVVNSAKDKFMYRESPTGGTVKQKLNSQGERVDDTSDKETIDIIDRENEDRETKKGLLSKVSSIGLGITGLVSKLFGKKDDDKKDGGIFGFLKDKLIGEDGILSSLSGVFKFFTGGKTGFLNSGLANIFKGILGPALFATAFTGKADGIISQIANMFLPKGNEAKNADNPNYGEKTEITGVDSNGDIVYIQADKNGNPVTNNNGDYITVGGETVSGNQNLKYEASGRTASSRIREQTARGLTTGSVNKTLFGKTFSKIGSKISGSKAASAAKGVKNYVSNINNIEKAGGKAAESAKVFENALFKDNIVECIGKWSSALKKIPLIGKHLGSSIDELGEKLAKTISESLEKNSGKLTKLAGVASTFAWVAKIAFIAVDFTTGYQDARTTLGIIDEPTFGQKILSGLIRTIKNLIPFIGILIPDKVLVNLFTDAIAPRLGMNSSELTDQRQKAKETVEQYNEEHGTRYSIEDYNKQVLGNWTWTEKIGNGVKSAYKNIKNRGLGKTVKSAATGIVDGVKNMGSKFVDSYTKNGEGFKGAKNAVGDTITNIGDKFGNMLPGIFGDIFKANMDIKSLAVKGDLLKMWKVSIKSSNQNENGDVETTVPSLFGRVLGQIPLIVNKVSMTPVAFLSNIGQKIWDKAETLTSHVTESASIIGNSVKFGWDTIHSTDDDGKANGTLTDFLDMSNIKVSEDNPFGTVTKIVSMIGRVLTVPAAFIAKVASSAWNGLKTRVFEPVKNGISTTLGNGTDLLYYVADGDISGLLNHEIKDDKGNPLGGLFKAVNFGEKIIFTVPTLFRAAGKGIHEYFSGIGTRISKDGSIFNENISAYNMYSEDGDISKIWGKDANFDKKDPIHPLFSAGLTIVKIFKVITTFLSNITKPITKFVGGVKDKVSNFVSDTKDGIVDKITNNDFVNSAKNTLNKGWNSFTNWVTGSGSGIAQEQFISQVDPKYADKSFSSSNVAQQGCGPAVAAMAVNAAKGNGGVSMVDAVNYANSNGYVTNNGTNATYFGSMFADNGLQSQYSANPNDIAMQISAGNPTVLLGQDSSNTSKTKSPFGSGDHYVLAKGFDVNGNVIIDDPESKTGNKVYNRSILNKVKLGVTAKANGSRVRKAINKFRFNNRQLYGGSSDNRAIVWAFLKGKGASDTAAAAIIGNLMQESGCNPSLHQKGGPGRGLIQWEEGSDRYNNMVRYANSKGCDWTDMQSQLEFFWKELTYEDKLEPTWNVSYCKKKYGYSNYGMGFVTSNEDVDTLTQKFCNGFERAGKPMMDKRIKYARQAYNDFSGKQIDVNMPTSVGMSNISSTNSSGTSGLSSLSNLLGNNLLSAAFGDTIGQLFGFSSGNTTTETASTTQSTGFSATNYNEKTGSSIAEDAKQYVGKIPYVWGGTSLTSGADCSGFTQAIMKKHGIEIPRTAAQQASSNQTGTVIDRSSAKAGDLIYFSNTGGRTGVTHTGIMIGPDEFVHAQSSKTGVVQTKLSGSSYDKKVHSIIRPQALQGSGSGLISSNGQLISMNNHKTSNLVTIGNDSYKISDYKQNNIVQAKDFLSKVSNGVSNSLNSDELLSLIKSVITLLTSVNSNTEKLNTIVDILTTYFKGSNNKSQVSTSKSNRSVNTGSNVDSNVNTQELIDMLTKLATN